MYRSYSPSKKIDIIVLNACGLKSKVICPDFLNLLKSCHIFVLTESKLDDADNELIENEFKNIGFTCYTDRHFVYTASCVNTTLALPTKKLGCQEIETIISSAFENWAIFRRDKIVIVLELLYLKMEVTVSEPCDVIRVMFYVPQLIYHQKVHPTHITICMMILKETYFC